VSHHKPPKWQALYLKALSEHDPAELPADIARAEGAIHSRLKRLANSPRFEGERHAIAEALSALHALKRVHLPGWNHG
jgi:hypothetical protein